MSAAKGPTLPMSYSTAFLSFWGIGSWVVLLIPTATSSHALLMPCAGALEKETGKVFQRRDRLTLGSILVITVVFILLIPMALFSSFDMLGTKVPVFSP